MRPSALAPGNGTSCPAMTTLRLCRGKMGVAPATAAPAPHESAGRFTPHKKNGKGGFAAFEMSLNCPCNRGSIDFQSRFVCKSIEVRLQVNRGSFENAPPPQNCQEGASLIFGF